MRHRLFVLLLGGSLAALPLTSALAAAASGAKPAATKPAKMATHATTGTVKSISGTSLVLTPSDRLAKEMTFTLASSTHRDAGVAIGSEVSVRYHTDGGVNTATAITPRHHSVVKK